MMSQRRLHQYDNIQKLSSTHFFSDIRHQNQCGNSSRRGRSESLCEARYVIDGAQNHQPRFTCIIRVEFVYACVDLSQ